MPTDICGWSGSGDPPYSDAEEGMPVDNFQEKVTFIWSVADLLRGDYKQSEYGKVILPLTVLRRLDSVLEPTKPQVLKRFDELKDRLDHERMGPLLQLAAAANVTTTTHHIDDHHVSRIHVEPSGHPVVAEVTAANNQGQFAKKEHFYVRLNNATRSIEDEKERERYIAQRWGIG
jgi:type I restriction-modification system DNA methylase subunit